MSPCPFLIVVDSTAIFAATDFQALGVLKAARQLGFKVPEQLAVIGFDDLDMAEYADLTTISQHLDESGRLAVEIVLAQIESPSRPPSQTSFNIDRAPNCVKVAY